MYRKIIYTTVFVICLPLKLLANAGSAMIWFGFLHLLVLNAVIGSIESLMLAKNGIANRTWLIVVANYTSMIIGFFFIAPYFSRMSGNKDFWGGQTNYGDYNSIGFVIGMIAAFFVTLLIEYPFFYFAVEDKSQRKELPYSFFTANGTTNLAIFVIYLIIVSS